MAGQLDESLFTERQVFDEGTLKTLRQYPGTAERVIERSVGINLDREPGTPSQSVRVDNHGHVSVYTEIPGRGCTYVEFDLDPESGIPGEPGGFSQCACPVPA